tara:strand:+ start:194 stop:538 length:345 start_codon:yes stop_codon:yes gene_type:complete
MITIRGGKQHERRIAQTTIDWAISNLSLQDHTFSLRLVIQALDDCYGECIHKKPNAFTIRLNTNMTIRDFVSTLIHEMIHVRQYLEDTWTHDGERECGELEMFLTDELWKSGLI